MAEERVINGMGNYKCAWRGGEACSEGGGDRDDWPVVPGRAPTIAV